MRLAGLKVNRGSEGSGVFSRWKINGVKWKLASTNNPATWHCIKYPFHLTPKSSHSHITHHLTTTHFPLSLFLRVFLSLSTLPNSYSLCNNQSTVHQWRFGCIPSFSLSSPQFHSSRVSFQRAFVPFRCSNGVWARNRRTAQLRHDLRRGLHGAQQEFRQRLTGFLSLPCLS